nr:allergen TBA-1=ABA-1 allergen homolog {N-terminal} [Toxocara canis, perienteric fluid, Peptide Partial, 36 aa] [Toxocara canis]
HHFTLEGSLESLLKLLGQEIVDLLKMKDKKIKKTLI